MDSSSTDSSGPAAPPVHRTPPDQILDDIVINEAPRAQREPRERDPPDLHDVVTQQTKILAGMLAELRVRQAVLRVRQAVPLQPANFAECLVHRRSVGMAGSYCSVCIHVSHYGLRSPAGSTLAAACDSKTEPTG